MSSTNLRKELDMSTDLVHFKRERNSKGFILFNFKVLNHFEKYFI